MYLRDVHLENVGPIAKLDVEPKFHFDGRPKPIVFVGTNGSGKSIVLSAIADALVEFAKTGYVDIVPNQSIGHSPYLRPVGTVNNRMGSKFGLTILQFGTETLKVHFWEKCGDVDADLLDMNLTMRFGSIMSWSADINQKKVEVPDPEKMRNYFRNSVVCYFPANRYERPHWLNSIAADQIPKFSFSPVIEDRLSKPVIVESTSEANKQ